MLLKVCFSPSAKPMEPKEKPFLPFESNDSRLSNSQQTW
jgi:hypothetical protein